MRGRRPLILSDECVSRVVLHVYKRLKLQGPKVLGIKGFCDRVPCRYGCAFNATLVRMVVYTATPTRPVVTNPPPTSRAPKLVSCTLLGGGGGDGGSKRAQTVQASTQARTTVSSCA